MNLRPFHWSSVTWGLLLMARALEAPVGLRVVQVVTAGVVEDTLFVGYAYTRLAHLTGRGWLAGALAVTVMALLHLTNWGVGPVLIYFVTGSVFIVPLLADWRLLP